MGIRFFKKCVIGLFVIQSLSFSEAKAQLALAPMLFAGACLLADQAVEDSFQSRGCLNKIRAVLSGKSKRDFFSDGSTDGFIDSSYHDVNCSRTDLKKGVRTEESCRYLIDQNGQHKKYPRQMMDIVSYAEHFISPQPSWTNFRCRSGAEVMIKARFQREVSDAGFFDDIEGRLYVYCAQPEGLMSANELSYEIQFEKNRTFGFRITGWVEVLPQGAQRKLNVYETSRLGRGYVNSKKIKEVTASENGIRVTNFGTPFCLLSNSLGYTSCDTSKSSVISLDETVWCPSNVLDWIEFSGDDSLRKTLLDQCESKPSGRATQMALKRTKIVNGRDSGKSLVLLGEAPVPYAQSKDSRLH